MSGPAFATKRLTASGAVTTGKSQLIAFLVNGGAAVGSVAFSQGSGGSTKVDCNVLANDSKFVRLGERGSVGFDENGIYVTLTNVNSVIVWYQ